MRDLYAPGAFSFLGYQFSLVVDIRDGCPRPLEEDRTLLFDGGGEYHFKLCALLEELYETCIVAVARDDDGAFKRLLIRISRHAQHQISVAIAFRFSHTVVDNLFEYKREAALL